jgi:hypothetical protein
VAYFGGKKIVSSASYLDRFRSAIPTRQGKQILRLLTEKRDSGEIKTVDEFKQRLQKLTTALIEETLKPTLVLYEAVAGREASYEQFNDMLDRIRDDLEAAFEEANNLEEIIASHHSIIFQVALKSLRYGVNQLESKITLYEFLGKTKRGFDDALFNTFREVEGINTSRADSAASLVYVDPIKGEVINNTEDAAVDIVGERLILGPDKITYIHVRGAEWLSNDSSPRSELDVSFPNSSINNLTDGKNNTFWVVPLLFESVLEDGAYLEVALHLNAAQDINFVEIEPANEFPVKLTAIAYIDGNETRQTTSVAETTIDSQTRVNFERITTSTLILQFKQENYKEVQFEKKLGESLFHKAALGQNNVDPEIDSVSEDLRNILSSEFILDIFSTKSPTGLMNKYYEYLIGFDNIKPGFNTFDDRSIFVSKKKTIVNPGVVSLKVDEVRPSRTPEEVEHTLNAFTYPVRSNTEDVRSYHSSVEYWLGVQRYDERDYLVSTDIVPIIPIGASRLYQERLILTAKTPTAVSSNYLNNNAGQIRLYTLADETDVLIYRNDILLTYGDDWDFIADGDSPSLTHISPGSGFAMSRGIYLTAEPSVLDVFTVSYSPKVSNTHIIPSDTTILDIVDLTGDRSIRMVKDNAIVFDPAKSSFTISKADLYLIVIMRRNSADPNLSPALEEFLLATATRDIGKFT